MKNIRFDSVSINGGFFADLQRLTREVTLGAVYDRFKETGRFDAFSCSWREGDPENMKPHVFWDSDVAKWIEAAAYYIKLSPDADDVPSLIEKIEDVIDNIEKNRMADGYFNCYYITCEPNARFTERGNHELYCAGHLIEAAVAYYEATGRDRFLNLMKDYADLIDRIFRVEDSAAFTTPGHEEIEIALFKLYRLTGEKKYFELAEFFLDKRGANEKDKEFCKDWWNQSAQQQNHLPVREQKEAVGHAVRACYLYTAMAEYVYETGDFEMGKAVKALFDNIANRRMYVTGGIGSNSSGEAFTSDYDLPNSRAYTETCAAIALAFFASAMQRSYGNDSVYAEILEKVIYNGAISGMSLDGESFFYENPLEIPPKWAKPEGSHFPKTQRSKVFGCSCCPPNIARFIPQIGGYAYTVDQMIVFVNQFMSSTAHVRILDSDAVVEQETNYPWDGKVKLTYRGERDARLAVRIPSWCDKYFADTVKGYAYFPVSDGDTVEIDFGMKPMLIGANAKVNEDLSKAALTVGPVVYCMEAVDNGECLGGIRIDPAGKFETAFDEENGYVTVTADGFRRKTPTALYAPLSTEEEKIKVKFIPYYAFANRGESEMQVWVNIK